MTLRHILIALSLFTVIACRTTPTNSGTKDSTHVDTTHIDTTAAKTSAIDGLVLKGPISPVQRQGDPNVAALAGAQIIISTAPSAGAGTGAIIANLTSDANGKFYVRLAAGRYRVSPQSFQNSPLPRPEDPTLVDVAVNTIVKDTIHYDTGIR